MLSLTPPESPKVKLRASLADRPHEHKFEVIAAIRDLVEKIVIYPHNDPHGRDIELVGQLAALLGPAHSPASGMTAISPR
jgi:hypothetical protein